MVALVMFVLVLVVAAVALRDGLRDGTVKPAMAAPVSRRARRPERARGVPAPTAPTRPIRAGLALVASSAGIGVLLALGVGLVAALLALALRTTVQG